MLASLSGLDNMEHVGWNLTVFNNDLLVDLDGLSSLQGVGGQLTLGGNALLFDIGGLDSLISLGGNLSITDNPVLYTCLATALRDRLLLLDWTGSATISGNDDLGTCE
jgi:hypothetical protein